MNGLLKVTYTLRFCFLGGLELSVGSRTQCVVRVPNVLYRDGYKVSLEMARVIQTCGSGFWVEQTIVGVGKDEPSNESRRRNFKLIEDYVYFRDMQLT